MDLSLAFMTGFLSSLHCAGMCGPLVLAYTTSGGGQSTSILRSLTSHLIYNSGRVISYGLVGGILGFIGGSVGALQGAGFWFSGIAGSATILFGLYVLRAGSMTPLGGTSDTAAGGKVVSFLLRLYRSSFGALIAKGTMETRFYVGLMTPLLPCGLLYGMLMRSAGSASAVEGATIMVAFGLGIVPSLVTAGFAGSLLSARTRRWADTVAAVLLILMGASLIWRAVMAGLGENSGAMHHH